MHLYSNVLMIVPLSLSQMQNNKHASQPMKHLNVTTDLRCYKMPFCFILFTALYPPDKSCQSPGTHAWQLCQGLVLAENHGKTRETISPGVMAVEWGINLDFGVLGVLGDSSVQPRPPRKQQHATDAVNEGQLLVNQEYS